MLLPRKPTSKNASEKHHPMPGLLHSSKSSEIRAKSESNAVANRISLFHPAERQREILQPSLRVSTNAECQLMMGKTGPVNSRAEIEPLLRPARQCSSRDHVQEV